MISFVLFFGFARHGESTFRFSETSDAIKIANLTVDTFVTTVIVTAGSTVVVDELGDAVQQTPGRTTAGGHQRAAATPFVQ